MRVTIRSILLAVACAPGVTNALASGTLDPALHDSVAARAFLPVGGVDFRADLEQGAIATVVRTPFGSSPTKAPQFVARRFDWDNQRIDIRSPRAIYDLDFSTTVEVNLETAEPVETAVLLSSGSLTLTAGPDVFVFCATDAVSGIRVAPLLRSSDGRFAPGQAIEMDTARALGKAREGVFGFGVDLDAWFSAGLIPDNMTLMGIVISHDGAPGSGSLAILEIVASDSPLFSEGGGAGGGGAPRALSLGGGSGRGSGGSGGDPRTPEDPIPSPGAGLLLGLGLAAAASRRRR